MSYLTDDEKTILKYTMIGGDLLHCPLPGCTRTIYALVRIHAEQEVHDAVRKMRLHLDTHTPADWLRFCASTVAVLQVSPPGAS